MFRVSILSKWSSDIEPTISGKKNKIQSWKVGLILAGHWEDRSGGAPARNWNKIVDFPNFPAGKNFTPECDTEGATGREIRRAYKRALKKNKGSTDSGLKENGEVRTALSGHRTPPNPNDEIHDSGVRTKDLNDTDGEEILFLSLTMYQLIN